MDGTYACGTISFYFSCLVICYLLYFNLLFCIFSYIRIDFVWKNKQNQTQITKNNKQRKRQKKIKIKNKYKNVKINYVADNLSD